GVSRLGRGRRADDSRGRDRARLRSRRRGPHSPRAARPSRALARGRALCGGDDRAAAGQGCSRHRSPDAVSDLTPLFAPRAVAVLGVSRNPAKLGYRLLENLKARGFAGAVHPVNPSGEEILGYETVRRVDDLPLDVDLALVSLPAPAVPDAVKALAARRVRAAVRDGRRCVRAGARLTASKPVVVLKGGRSDAGRRAAGSHTGSLAGSYDMFRAACLRARIVLADETEEFFDAIETLVTVGARRPLAPRIAILTVSGGPSVVAADTAERTGLEVPPLGDATGAALRAALPSFAAVG